MEIGTANLLGAAAAIGIGMSSVMDFEQQQQLGFTSNELHIVACKGLDLPTLEHKLNKGQSMISSSEYVRLRIKEAN